MLIGRNSGRSSIPSNESTAARTSTGRPVLRTSCSSYMAKSKSYRSNVCFSRWLKTDMSNLFQFKDYPFAVLRDVDDAGLLQSLEALFDLSVS